MKYNGSRLVYNIFGITYLVVGLVLIASAVFICINKSESIKSRMCVSAVVYEIDSSKEDITILYEAYDEIYFGKLDYYSSFLSKGDELDVYVDKNDPNDFVSDSKIPEIVLMILGFVFTAIGSVIIVVYFVKINSRKNLIKMGEVLNGVIVSAVKNEAITVNKKHPYIAECEIHSPLDGRCVKCRSENIMYDLSEFIGCEVTVYADLNKEKYYVDINELIERYKADWS